MCKNSIKPLIMTIISTLLIQGCVFGDGNIAENYQTITPIPEMQEQTITPDPRLQSEFDKLLYNNNEEKESAFSEILKNIQKMGDFEHLLQQCFYFSANTMRRYNRKEIPSSDMEKATVSVRVIIIRGLFGLDEKSPSVSSELAQHAINAIEPYLGTKDPELKKELHWMFESLQYREYESYIEKRKDNPPLKLVQYMYENPGKALLSLMRVYMKEDGEKEKIIQLEKAVMEGAEKSRKHDDSGATEERYKGILEVKEALNELSKYDEWWVRLYVIKIIYIGYYKPAFMSQDILDRFKEDKHPLISEELNRDRIPPEIEIIEAPSENEDIHNPRPSFNISCRDNQSGIGEVKVRLNGKEITEGLSITDGKLFYQPTTALKDNAYKLDIEVKDKAENTTKDFILFTIDTRSSK